MQSEILQRLFFALKQWCVQPTTLCSFSFCSDPPPQPPHPPKHLAGAEPMVSSNCCRGHESKNLVLPLFEPSSGSLRRKLTLPALSKLLRSLSYASEVTEGPSDIHPFSFDTLFPSNIDPKIDKNHYLVEAFDSFGQPVAMRLNESRWRLCAKVLDTFWWIELDQCNANQNRLMCHSKLYEHYFKTSIFIPQRLEEANVEAFLRFEL